MGTVLKDEESIEQIIRKMTLEEKALLVTGGSPFSSQPMEKYKIPAVVMLDGATGYNSGQADIEKAFELAATQMKETGEPLDRESLTDQGGLLLGVKTLQELEGMNPQKQPQEIGCYPTGMFLGATWSPETVEACGSALAKEMGARGVDIILGPNVNIHRDPLGGRLFEGYSEDPCLVAGLAPHFVLGIQQEGLAANVKHFAVNNQETDRMGVDVHISERALREIYFPGFKACLDAGCKTIMSAYNRINGVPCAMNKWLLYSVLREEWGFDGFVISDWAAAYDQVEAVRAGNDLAMPGPRGIRSIINAVTEGQLEEERLDACIRNFLKVVLTLPVMTGKRPSFDIQESILAAEAAAREGITLLKNDGVLPLDRKVKVAFYGQRSKNFAGSGEGSAGVDTSLLTNPYDSTIALLGEENVTFNKAEKDTDIWIVTVGANGQEGSDRQHMDMDEDDKTALDTAIAEANANNGKVILVLNTAGPVYLMDYINHISALICSYYPGMQGGKVLADVLFGLVNPSGKLPLTYPKYYRDCASYKNFPGENKEVWYGEGIYVGYRYYDSKKIEPLYPFGFGLSYTTFEISDLLIADTVDVEKEIVKINVTVKNTGKMNGSEVVQVYVHDVASGIDKPEKELKAFKKVFLRAGEKKIITLELQKQDFASYSMKLAGWICEPGDFDILIGNSATDIRMSKRIHILCNNPFRFSENTSIGDIAADENAVKLMNHILQMDFLKTAEHAIVFFPQKPLNEIWEIMLAPTLQDNGLPTEVIHEKYVDIIKGLAAL